MKTRLLIASLVTLAVASHAVADDPPAGGGGGTGDGTDASGAPAPDPTTPPADAAAPATRYPRDIINRPLTLPKGIFVAGVDVTNFTSSFFDPALIRILAGYGVTDDFELGFAHYAFPTDDAGKGSIDANLGYKILRGAAGGKLEMIARAQGGYSLAAKDANPIAVGAHVQYNATPKIAIITTGQQLSIGIAGDVKPITFSLPVSIGFQATPTLYAQLDTSFATFAINSDAGDSVFFGSDVTPFFLGGYLNAIPAVDVFAGLGSLNLTPPDGVKVGDTLYVTVGVRYYGGKL